MKVHLLEVDGEKHKPLNVIVRPPSPAVSIMSISSTDSVILINNDEDELAELAESDEDGDDVNIEF